MSTAIQDANAEQVPFFRLWFVEVPVDSRDHGINKIFPTGKAALHYLWHYVQGRILSNSADLFAQAFETMLSRYGIESNDDSDLSENTLQRALLMLNFNDASSVIDWYFNFANGNDMDAQYEFIKYFGSLDESGVEVYIRKLYTANDFEHPLLDLAGISIVRQDDRLSYGARKSNGMEFGPYYATPFEATSVAVTSVLVEVMDQLKVSPDSLIHSTHTDLVEMFRKVRV